MIVFTTILFVVLPVICEGLVSGVFFPGSNGFNDGGKHPRKVGKDISCLMRLTTDQYVVECYSLKEGKINLRQGWIPNEPQSKTYKQYAILMKKENHKCSPLAVFAMSTCTDANRYIHVDESGLKLTVNIASAKWQEYSLFGIGEINEPRRLLREFTARIGEIRQTNWSKTNKGCKASQSPPSVLDVANGCH